MSNRSETVTAELLREWGMPDPGESKKSRGDVVVVGGSLRTPGAVVLAGECALRAGAGRLALVVPETIQVHIGVAIPEAAVWSLPHSADTRLDGPVRDTVSSADAVLVGPGFDDPDETRETLMTIAECAPRCLVLDAFALGVLPVVDRGTLPSSLVLTPNREEVAILRGHEASDDLEDLLEVARRYDAVVSCYGDIAEPGGDSWHTTTGGAGLGTSGSGDVLAGLIAGYAARGLDPAHAAVRGTWVHGRAGDRLTDRVGVGFLARDLAAEVNAAAKEAN